ncbi:hypothetical protein T484DRAFT_1943818, partial [Baffinella frigidus]|mmetsp:Transcript_7979/g.19410  ORF Transcript_7979/g.19410 Transcript_7979/m.19410 type:complete len:130 (+) Transcript_7979:3-392(+)
MPKEGATSAMSASWVLKAASISGALAIGLGAFGAHGLKGKVPVEMIKVWETAAHYHLVHSAALLGLAAANKQGLTSKRAAKLAPPLMAAGVLLFSGSLYAMVLTGNKKLGIVTPIGGVLLIGGWVAMAI